MPRHLALVLDGHSGSNGPNGPNRPPPASSVSASAQGPGLVVVDAWLGAVVSTAPLPLPNLANCGQQRLGASALARRGARDSEHGGAGWAYNGGHFGTLALVARAPLAPSTSSAEAAAGKAGKAGKEDIQGQVDTKGKAGKEGK